MRKISLLLLLGTGWVVGGVAASYYVPLFRDGYVSASRGDKQAAQYAILYMSLVIISLVFAPHSVTLDPWGTRRFFALHGLNVGADDYARRLCVTVTTSLDELGVEEVCADGRIVRVPFILMRRPMLTRDYLFFPVRNKERDSILWSVLGVGAIVRPDWDGGGVALPREGLGDVRAVARDARARVREATRRYRQAKRSAKRSKHDPKAGDEAMHLIEAELAWLEEAESANQEHDKGRQTD